MNGVELYAKVRYAVRMRISRLEVGRRFGIDPRTVAKMLSFSLPAGYRSPGRRRVRAWIHCGDIGGLKRRLQDGATADALRAVCDLD